MNQAPAIYFHLRRVAAAEIPRLRTDPSLATLYANAAIGMELGGVRPSGLETQASLDRIRNDPSLKAGLETMLKGAGKLGQAIPVDTDEYLRQASSFAADLRRPAPEDTFYLDKAWHVLHYVFTGQAEIGTPPAGTLLGGEKVGDKLAYARPRLIDAALTLAFAGFLDRRTIPELHKRIDIRQMHASEVYGCEEPTPAHEKRAHQWVRQYVPALRTYVRHVAEQADGMLLWLW